MGSLWSAEYKSDAWEQRNAVIGELADVGHQLIYGFRAVRYEGPSKIVPTTLERRTGLFGRRKVLYAEDSEQADTVMRYILNNPTASDWKLAVKDKTVAVESGMFRLEDFRKFSGGDSVKVREIFDKWDVGEDDRSKFSQEESSTLGYLPVFDQSHANSFAGMIELGANSPVAVEEAIAMRDAIISYAKEHRSRDFSHLLETPVWIGIHSSVSPIALNRIEHESATREIVGDMSQLNMDEEEIRELLAIVEISGLEPEQKLLAAHVLFRTLQGKEIKETEIPLMRELFGEEFANALQGSVLAD